MKEWDDAADSWVDFVREGKDYFRDELNNPGMFRVLGNVKDLSVLDVACGEGYNTRIMACKGARVIGIDFSKKLMEQARLKEKEDPFGIDYHVADATDLSIFSDGRFDLVTCFMAIMDIEDYNAAICEIARVVKDAGRFVFSNTHPCFEYTTQKGRIERVTTYFGARTEKIPWEMERLIKPFVTTSFHRTLTDYSNTLCRHGFFIRRILEPRPARKGATKYPSLKQVFSIPHSMIFETVKCPTRRKREKILSS